MAITLPDIVQRVVLDTRRFSGGMRGVRKELQSTGGAADQAAGALGRSAKAHDEAARSSDKNSSAIARVNRNVKAATPSILRLADNLYKVRLRHDQSAQAAQKHGRVHKWLVSHLKSAAKAGALMGAKIGLLGVALLNVLPMVGALGGALVALVGSMGRLFGILPALGGLFVGLGAAIASVLVMFSGVKDAMKLQSKAGAESAKSTKAVANAQRSGAKAIASAQKAIVSASRAVTDAKEAEAEAWAEISEVEYQGVRRVMDATRALSQSRSAQAEAQSKVAAAETALAASYKKAEENLANLRRETERADIAQQRSEIGLRQAQQNLIDTLAGGDTDSILSAMLDLRTAELDAADATDSLSDSKAALADAERKGVKNADAVTEARNELIEAKNAESDATWDLREAELDLMDAQRESAKANLEARKRAVEATQATADAVDDLREAELGLAEARDDAARSVADAGASGGSAPSSSGEPPSKEAMAIAKALKIAKDELKPIKGYIQSITFADIIEGIRSGTKLAVRFKKPLGDTAKIISGSIASFPGYLAMAAPSIERVWGANNRLMGSVARLGGVATVAMAAVTDAGSFILDHFARVSDEVSDRITKAISNPEAYGKMQAFFMRALNSAILWWRILRDFSVGIFNVFSAGADVGDKMAATTAEVAARFREWTGDKANREKMHDFFVDARELASKIWGFFVEIGKAIGAIATGPGIAAISGLIDKMFPSSGGKGSPLGEVLASFGNRVILDTVAAISGVLDVLRGNREAATPLEALADALTTMTDLTSLITPFTSTLAGIVSAVSWMVDNVPGFEGFVKAASALAALRFVSGKTGLNGVLRGAVGVADRVINYKTGLPAVAREAKRTADALDAPVKRSKYGVVNWLRNIPKEVQSADSGIERSAKPMRSRLSRLGDIASGTGTQIGVVGGALWALSTFAPDGSILADVLNKVGAGMVFIGSMAELASSIAGFSSAMKLADGSTKAMAGSQAALNTAWYASPITWIIAAVIAVGAALYLLYKKNEGFRKFVDNLWQSIQRAWDRILPVLKAAWSWIAEKAVAGFKTLAAVAADVWGKVSAAASWAWENVLRPVFDFIVKVIDEVVVPGFQRLWGFAKFIFTAIGEWIGFIWRTFIEPYLKAWWFVLTNVVIPILKVLWGVAKFIFTAIGEWIGFIWRTFIAPVFTAIVGFIRDKLIPWFKDFSGKASETWEIVKSAISVAWEKVKPLLQALVDFIKDKVISRFDGLKDAASSAWDTISNGFKTAWDKAKAGFNGSLRAIGSLVKPFLSAAATVAGALGMDETNKSLRDAATAVGKWGQEKAEGGTIEAARGARFPGALRRAQGVRGGFKTGVPKAIVGEGSRYPEYVIPTDPKYRGRARSLLLAAARDMGRGPSGRFSRGVVPDFATGGRMPEFALGGIFDGVRGFVADRIEDVWPEDWVKPSDREPGKPFSKDGVNYALHYLRGKLVDLVRDRQAKLNVSQVALGALNKTTGLNQAFLSLFNQWNSSIGSPYGILSGWRSTEKQAQLYAAYLAGTGNLAARPGTSRHEFGLAIDTTPSVTRAHQLIARMFGLHFPVRGEPWHVEPINLANPFAGVPGYAGNQAGGILDGVPHLSRGGIAVGDTLARIGEMSRPEAVVPLDSPRGRRMLGDDDRRPSVTIDMRGMVVHGGDPEAIKAAVKEGVEEALEATADLVEIRYQ